MLPIVNLSRAYKWSKLAVIHKRHHAQKDSFSPPTTRDAPEDRLSPRPTKMVSCSCRVLTRPDIQAKAWPASSEQQQSLGRVKFNDGWLQTSGCKWVVTNGQSRAAAARRVPRSPRAPPLFFHDEAPALRQVHTTGERSGACLDDTRWSHAARKTHHWLHRASHTLPMPSQTTGRMAKRRGRPRNPTHWPRCLHTARRPRS